MRSFRCRSSAQAPPRGALVALIVTWGLVLSGCSSGGSATESNPELRQIDVAAMTATLDDAIEELLVPVRLR